MYTFFVVFGFLFVSVSTTFINYIYDVFSINRMTNFLSPINDKIIWNKISIIILPILIWSLIELPILGNNGNFILAVLMNIFISCAMIYEIRYTTMLLFNKENNTINLISIYIASLFGQMTSFIIFKMQPFFKGDLFISSMFLLIIVIIFVLIKIYPPKTKFFSGIEKKD